VVAFVWLAGCAVLLAGTLMLRALGAAKVRMARFEFRGERPGSRPMKDVTPRQSEHEWPDGDRPRLIPPERREPD
jgi:hypothetical protein